VTDISGSSSSSSGATGKLDWTGPAAGNAGATSTTGTVDTVFPPYRGMEYEESEALKIALSWLTVPDARGNTQKVKVWFRLPERELREVTYPNIIIDYIGMIPRRNEEHRGYVPFYYEQNTANELAQGTSAMSIFPLPCYLQYQITTETRDNQQSVMINDILLTSVLPIRYGQLTMLTGTVRRLDVLAFQQPADSLDKDGKRLFRRVWTINISSEVVLTYDYPAQVTEIELNVTYPLQNE
jgi:hypothetical protein